MSRENKQKNKLVGQKEALGIYLDSLLGVSVFEEDKNSETSAIEEINDQEDEEIDIAHDSANINSRVQNHSDQSISGGIDKDDQQLVSTQAQENVSSDIILEVGSSMTSEPLMDTGSLSVKYLNSLKQDDTKNVVVRADSPITDKTEQAVVKNEPVVKEPEMAARETALQETTYQTDNDAESETNIKEPSGGEEGQLNATADVTDTHDIYRQKLLDRQKQIKQRKEQRKRQRLEQKQRQSSKISLSTADQEGTENNQVLIPRSQFLKNRQIRENTGSGLENSSGVISLEEKKQARESLQQKNEEIQLQINKKQSSSAVEEQTVEYVRAANAKLISDTAISESFSESELMDNVKDKSKQDSPEDKNFQSLKESVNGRETASDNLKVEDSSISAFSRFAEQNNQLHEPSIQDSESDFAEQHNKIQSSQTEQDPYSVQPQIDKEEKTENNHQFVDAPDLDLSLFLPKIPSLAEIEAIEQKEKLLHTQQFVPDSSKEITAEVSEQTNIQSGISISTELVSPHSKKQKSLAPNWAEPSFQAMFFDVAGLKLAIPLLELNGIVEWGRDYITPMPGHEKWYLGLLQYRGKSVPIIDTLQQVFPPNQAKRLLKERNKFKNIIMIDDGNWGLACEQVIGIRTIAADAVKWRTDQTKRRWLLGTVKDQMCALLDGKQFASMLKTGEDSLVPRQNKKTAE